MLHRLSLLLLLLCSSIVAPATLTVYNMKARGIRRVLFSNANGFVKVYYNNRHFGTTEVKNNTAYPVWTDSFSYGRAFSGSVLKLKVYDKKLLYNRLLGICEDNIRTGDRLHTSFLFTGGRLQYRYSLQ